MLQALFEACLVVSLLVALVLVAAGVYMAIFGRSASGPEERVSVLGLFSISSHRSAVGFVFSGLVLLVLCLLLSSRFVSR